MKLGRFNPQAWEAMLKERKAYKENGEKFAMSVLLKKHHIALQWTPFIEPAVAHFQAQKNRPLVRIDEFFLYVRTLRDQTLDKKIPSKEVGLTNYLKETSLEDLISEINRRGFKVYQQ